MMFAEDNKGIGVYAVNSYIWKALQVNLGMSPSDYDGAVPIIPLSQEPELMDTGKAFITYGVSIRTPKHLYQTREETVYYRIWAPTVGELNKIFTLITRLLERQDEAASDINEWLVTEAAGRGKSRDLSILSVRTTVSERPAGARDEGGYSSVGLLFELCYVTFDDDNLQTNGFVF